MTTWRQHYTASLNLRPRLPAPSAAARDLRARLGVDLSGQPLAAPTEPCRAIIVYVPPERYFTLARTSTVGNLPKGSDS